MGASATHEPPMDPCAHELMNLRRAKLTHDFAEQLAKSREASVAFEVLLDVTDGAGNVLDVNGVSADARLVAECAERFQVPLQRHHVRSEEHTSELQSLA